MWVHDEAFGYVSKITSDYIVVIWEGINGEWHYTQKQAERLEIIADNIMES